MERKFWSKVKIKELFKTHITMTGNRCKMYWNVTKVSLISIQCFILYSKITSIVFKTYIMPSLFHLSMFFSLYSVFLSFSLSIPSFNPFLYIFYFSMFFSLSLFYLSMILYILNASKCWLSSTLHFKAS